MTTASADAALRAFVDRVCDPAVGALSVAVETPIVLTTTVARVTDAVRERVYAAERAIVDAYPHVAFDFRLREQPRPARP